MLVQTRKLSDKKVVEVLNELFDKIDEIEVAGAYFGGVSFSANKAEDLGKISSKSNETLIQSFSVKKSGGTSHEIRFGRGTTDHARVTSNQNIFHYFNQFRCSDAHFDEFGFLDHPSPNQANFKSFSSDERMSVARIASGLAVPIGKLPSQDSKALGRVFDQNLADLQRISSEFLERMADARTADEEAFKDRLAKLQSEYDQRNAQLKRDAKDLEKRRKELDDREPQHERRRLRKELTGDLQLFLEKPPEGGFLKRNVVYLLFVAAGAIFVAISVALTLRVELADAVAEAPFWANTLKATASGVGGAAFIWAGLAGLRQSSERQRDFSQKLQRYSFDMDRASWVVETLLQMNSLESAQVPDAWLESVCRELFTDASEANTASAPLEALASLLDATARAKIGSGGYEFEIDKKNAQSLAKQT